MTEPEIIALSLVSHTNVGKTTLARTLLARDIGEVRDVPHVTEFAEVHTMLKTPAGDQLQLWDTPGFGDSVRLIRRLRQSANPIGWFIGEVWDRWRDRPFWAAQQALKNVRDEADVLLYVVSAAETPEAAGYVAPEMELLAWTGKPVVVLLNQLGSPGGAADADVERWRRHVGALAPRAMVLSFDAFARCWVQEVVLLEAIAAALDSPERRAAMERLIAAWRAARLADFDAAMAILADSIARIASAREMIDEGASLMARLRGVGATIGLGRGGADDPGTAAQTRLAAHLTAEVREATSALIRLHRLDGASEAEILEAVQVELHQKVDAGWAAIWGGAVSGALAGLSADVLAGGLTFGGGLLAGGVLGALGAAGLAHGVNKVRGTDRSWLAWNGDALQQILEAQLLRYLAVAHFGRGRGAWSDDAAPAHWPAVVHAALEPHRATLESLWHERGSSEPSGELREGTREVVGETVRTVIREVLGRLYPRAVRAFEPAPAAEAGESAQPSRLSSR
ncbi:MAG: GTPase domain-containing protein [Caldimonas sp.]